MGVGRPGSPRPGPRATRPRPTGSSRPSSTTRSRRAPRPWRAPGWRRRGGGGGGRSGGRPRGPRRRLLPGPAGRAAGEALSGLAAIFREQLDWAALAAVLDLVDRDRDLRGAARDLAALRIAAALGRRDLGGPPARRGRGAPAPVRALVGALQGATPTPHGGVRSVHVAGDRVALVEWAGAKPAAITLADRAPGLPTRWRSPVPEGTDHVVVVGGAPLAIFFDREATTTHALVRMGDEGPTPIFRWDGDVAVSGAAADLDRDGVVEVYVGTVDLEILALTPGADGVWTSRVVHDAHQTLESAAHGLLPVDVDGDGQDELIATFTGWRAYDLRILRLGRGGALELVDRDKLGVVLSPALVRGPGGAQLLAVKNLAVEESPLVFPPDRRSGEPPGIYVYDLERGLRGQRRPPLPLPAGAALAGVLESPQAADLDGDGLGEIAVALRVGDRVHTLVYVQGADGGWTPVVLGDLCFLGLADVDDDPMAEVIAELPGEGAVGPRVVVLGAGERPLEPVGVGGGVAEVSASGGAGDGSPADLDDPTWAPARDRARALADLGLHRAAGDAFVDLARRAPSAAARAEASLVAGDLFERAGDERRAIPLFQAAARAPELASSARLRIARAELRLGDYDQAREALAALADFAEVDPEARALARRYAPLAVGGDEAIEIDLRRPLGPAWTLHDPLALAHAPGGDGLSIATASSGLLATLPLESAGEVLELEVELTLDQTEWRSRFELLLAPEDDPERPILALDVTTHGTSRGGVSVRRVITCHVPGERAIVDNTADLAARRLTLRLDGLPTLGESGCDLAEDGQEPRRAHLRHAAAPPAGRYRLSLRALGDASAWVDAPVETPAWLALSLQRLRLRGFRIGAPPAADPRVALRRALVDGDPVAFLAAEGELPARTPEERLWRVHALVLVGRLADARDAWAELLADPTLAMAPVATLLRGHPTLHWPLIRELDPDRALELLVASWRNTAINHLDDPAARAALLVLLRGLDAATLGVDAESPRIRARARELLVWRGRALARAGEPDLARADLERALALTDALGSEGEDPWLLRLDLAVLAAERGDLDDARAHVLAAHARCESPLLIRDVVLARPALARFAAELP
ncbi:MAG: hypothetical protein R3B09_17970 [Nannocystaceae bacterium]